MVEASSLIDHYIIVDILNLIILFTDLFEQNNYNCVYFKNLCWLPYLTEELKQQTQWTNEVLLLQCDETKDLSNSLSFQIMVNAKIPLFQG